MMFRLSACVPLMVTAAVSIAATCSCVAPPLAASDKEKGREDLPPARKIGPAPMGSRVPAPYRQGVALPPQSISAVDVRDDGRHVALSTMACRHDGNFWLLSAEKGEVVWGRYVDTWAPSHVRALASEKGFAVGLTYGPVTSVGSTVARFRGEKDAISYAYDWPLTGG